MSLVTRGFVDSGSLLVTRGFSHGAAPAVVYTSGPFYRPQRQDIADERRLSTEVADSRSGLNDEQQIP